MGIPVEWMLVNITPIYEKSRKEDPRNHKLDILTSVSGKVMEVILNVIT